MAPRLPSGKDGPEPIAEILSRLFTMKGWGRRQSRLHLERAWAEAVGKDFAKSTRLLSLRRGIMEIEVATGVLLQELAGFHKRKLLEKLRQLLPNEKIQDLRFKAGNF